MNATFCLLESLYINVWVVITSQLPRLPGLQFSPKRQPTSWPRWGVTDGWNTQHRWGRAALTCDPVFSCWKWPAFRGYHGRRTRCWRAGGHPLHGNPSKQPLVRTRAPPSGCVTSRGHGSTPAYRLARGRLLLVLLISARVSQCVHISAIADPHLRGNHLHRLLGTIAASMCFELSGTYLPLPAIFHF